jgi:hypothetical protein
MEFWISNIWNNHSRNMQRNLLILDDYSVHKTENIITKLEGARTSVLLILEGLQPLDIGINNIMKQELRNKFASMMVNKGGEMNSEEATDSMGK